MDSPLEQHSGMAATRTLPAPCHTPTTPTSACTSPTHTSPGTRQDKIQGEASKTPDSCVQSMEGSCHTSTQGSRVALVLVTCGTGSTMAQDKTGLAGPADQAGGGRE